MDEWVNKSILTCETELWAVTLKISISHYKLCHIQLNFLYIPLAEFVFRNHCVVQPTLDLQLKNRAAEQVSKSNFVCSGYSVTS